MVALKKILSDLIDQAGLPSESYDDLGEEGESGLQEAKAGVPPFDWRKLLFWANVGYSLFFCTMLALSYLKHQSKEREYEHEKIHLEKLANRLINDEKILTLSAKLYAMTGQKKWEKRYQQLWPDFQQMAKEVFTYGHDQINKKIFEEGLEARRKLYEMEQHAFSLAQVRNNDKAYLYLTSAEYEKQRGLFRWALNSFERERSELYLLEKMTDELMAAREEMYMTVQLAIETGDVRWEYLYQESEILFDDHLHLIKMLVPQRLHGEIEALIKEGHQNLGKVEEGVFELLRSGQREFAAAGPNSQAYYLQLMRMNQHLSQLDEEVTAYIEEKLGAKKKQDQVLFALIIFGMLLMVGLWTFYYVKAEEGPLPQEREQRTGPKFRPYLVQAQDEDSPEDDLPPLPTSGPDEDEDEDENKV